MNIVVTHINTINPWIIMTLAIMCSTFGTTCLKLSDGFRRFWPVVGVGIGYGFFFFTITLVFKRVDMGMGYAVWSGLSTTMVSIVGAVFFKESMNWKKAFSLALIIMGIVGMHLSDKIVF